MLDTWAITLSYNPAMTMPEVNPHPRGTLEWAQWERDHQTAGPQQQSTRPTAENVLPGGTWAGPPGQPGSVYTAPNPAGGFILQTVQQDGTLSNQATASRLGASSGGGGGYTPSDPNRYNDAKAARQAAQGATDTLPPRAIEYAPGRAWWQPQGMAGVVLQKDSETGKWVNSGYTVTNRQEQQQIRNAVAQQALGNQGSAPQQQQQGAPTGTMGTPQLQGPVAPRVGAPPMPNDPNTRTSYLPSSVNNIAIQNRNQGFNGFINPGIGTRAPASLGYGPAVSTNQIQFSPGERGYTMADNPIRNVSYTTPSDYRYDMATRQDERGFARPMTMGVNLGGPVIPGAEGAFDPFNPAAGAPQQQAGTIPLSMAGQNVLFSAPDKSWSTGFVLDAMPASNIAMAQGRDFSGLNPAAQTAATWALLDEQMNGAMSGAYRTGDGSYIFGGGGGGGFDPFASAGGDYDATMRAANGGTFTFNPGMGGGRAVTRPLAGQPGGPRELITNKPLVLVEPDTGKIRGLVGEDNADRDRLPDRERLTFTGNQMHVTPLDPPMRFDTGGTITTTPDPVSPTTGLTRTMHSTYGWTWDGPDDPPAAPTPTLTGPTAPVPTVKPPSAPPAPTAYDPPPAYEPPPLTGFDPFNASILAPWQAAQQRNILQQQRMDNMQYRRNAAGLRGPTAIQVQGDVPNAPLPAGAFYDTSGRVNEVINQITGATSNLQALGPDEDITPIMSRVTDIGISLDDMARIRQLQDARVAAEATAGVPSASDGSVATWQAELNNLAATIGAAQRAFDIDPNQGADAKRYLNNLYQQQADLETRIRKANELGVESLDKAAIIDAQIGAIQSRLPANANEATLRTELAREQERIARQDKRTGLTQQVFNLAKVGVPKLNGPILPVTVAA